MAASLRVASQWDGNGRTILFVGEGLFSGFEDKPGIFCRLADRPNKWLFRRRMRPFSGQDLRCKRFKTRLYAAHLLVEVVDELLELEFFHLESHERFI
jgi:hypothetical protein